MGATEEQLVELRSLHAELEYLQGEKPQDKRCDELADLMELAMPGLFFDGELDTGSHEAPPAAPEAPPRDAQDKSSCAFGGVQVAMRRPAAADVRTELEREDWQWRQGVGSMGFSLDWQWVQALSLKGEAQIAILMAGTETRYVVGLATTKLRKIGVQGWVAVIPQLCSPWNGLGRARANRRRLGRERAGPQDGR
ncbi:unnamed protein product, partial [Prorocentrum cordatum]